MTLTLVYDGGCPFCRQFALRSELLSGIPDLNIVDGRVDHALRRELNRRRLPLKDGAVLLDGDRSWHGSDAVAELSRRMNASDPLLLGLSTLFRNRTTASRLYPALLLARRMALASRGLSPDPDQTALSRNTDDAG